MKKKFKALFAIAVYLTSNVCFAQLPVTPTSNQKMFLKSTNPELAKNKKLVYDFWREVFEGGHFELADKYLSDTYIQHNPNVATGKKGFLDFFSKVAKPHPISEVIKMPLVAIVAEGDYVTFSFVREMTYPNEPTKKYTTTWFDMFRIDNGKIAEHWDTAEIWKKEN